MLLVELVSKLFFAFYYICMSKIRNQAFIGEYERMYKGKDKPNKRSPNPKLTVVDFLGVSFAY